MAAARAAGAADTIMVASTIANCTAEEIAGAATGPLWFQLYVYKDRELTRDLVARVEAAGYGALALTVDTPLLGRRERDLRNRFALPPGITIKNFEVARERLPGVLRWDDASSFWAYVHRQFDASLTWETLGWLRSIRACRSCSRAS